MNRRSFIKAGVLTGVAATTTTMNAESPKTDAEIIEASYESLTPAEQERRSQLDKQLRERALVERPKDPRPNILFIFTDQQAAQALSCAGNPLVNTPNMDRLAARGVRFTRNYCPDPICGPSRSAMITGRMPHETGVVFNNDAPDLSIANYGERLREAGYDTTWIGKWHLPKSFDPSHQIPGFRNVPVPEGMRWPALARGDLTDMHFAGEAYRLLRFEMTKHSNPWCLTVSLHNPHDICYECMDTTPLPYLNLDRYPPLPANFQPAPDQPSILADSKDEMISGQEMTFTRDWSEERWRAYLDAYYRMTQSVDYAIGVILDGLEESGLADQTLVVLSSDHGEGMASHQWVCKNAFYEDVVSVPLIASWPGRIPEGATNDMLASGLDLAPTFCDYAKASAEGMSGISLRQAMESGQPAEREAVFAELTLYPKERPTRGRMVRTDRYKYYVLDRGENCEQLFDLQNDPGEQHNLTTDPAHAETRQHHRQLLARWCQSTNDTFPLDAA